MIRYQQPEFIPVQNGSSEDMPPYSVVIPDGTRHFSSVNYTANAVALVVDKPATFNQRPLLVTGPFPIRAGEAGLAFIRGPMPVRVPSTYSASTGDHLGAGEDSFLASQGANGLLCLLTSGAQADDVTGEYSVLCDYQNHLMLEAGNIIAGGGSIASGAVVGPGSVYTLDGQNLTREIAAGGVTLNSHLTCVYEGTYHFGFSLTAEGPEANIGDLMNFGLYNITDGAYTGHYAAAENFWDTIYTTNVNPHRCNIALTGLANVSAMDSLGIYNASAFTVTVTNFNFWMSKHG